MTSVSVQIWMNAVTTTATVLTSVQTVEGRTGVPVHLASGYKTIVWRAWVKIALYKLYRDNWTEDSVLCITWQQRRILNHRHVSKFRFNKALMRVILEPFSAHVSNCFLIQKVLNFLPNGPHKTTFGFFEMINVEIWRIFFPFSVIWGPMGVKIAKRYSSYNSQAKAFKLFLKFPPQCFSQNYFQFLGIYEILSFRFFFFFFSKISTSWLYPVEKSETLVTCKKSGRRTNRSESWDSRTIVQHIWGTFSHAAFNGILGSFGALAFFAIMRFSKCSFFYT